MLAAISGGIILIYLYLQKKGYLAASRTALSGSPVYASATLAYSAPGISLPSTVSADPGGDLFAIDQAKYTGAGLAQPSVITGGAGSDLAPNLFDQYWQESA